jgi:hypothetical protein
MIKAITTSLLLLVSIGCFAPPVAPFKTTSAWGFFAHKRINRLAVFTLPEDMFSFYKKHIEFITEHAVDPDKRRYATEGEAPRHYVDIDHYVHEGENPFEVVPRSWKKAVEKFSEDTLKAYGIVPWHIDNMMYRLTKAFKDGNLDRVLQLSADLGHYVGDSHVPLHTTENYNGHLTNQRGIHGFWESRLPELYHDDYDFFVGKAKYVDSPLDKAWETVESSFWAVDSVLKFEAKLNAEYPKDKKYSYENRGQALMKVYSEEYARTYHKMLDNMVERRMKSAVITTGSLWYTAWVNAGQPDLNTLGKDISEDLQKKLKEEEDSWKGGTIKGREHD